jgi:hypothetical protein
MINLNYPSFVSYCAKWFSVSHKVYNECSWRDKEEFHESIVEGDKVHEEIHIPYAKYE